MVPACSYEIICNTVRWQLKELYDHGEKEPVRMVGILFARPGSRTTDSEILLNLDYFHHRSGQNIDFFCGGFGQYWRNWIKEYPDQIAIARGKDEKWLYSASKFNEFRKEIESMTKWQYSGAADLLLTNAKYCPENNSAYLDFSSTLFCNLEAMIVMQAITSVESFFEDIFRFAETAFGDDPTCVFSDRKGISTGGSALKRFLLALLPKKLGDDFKKLEHFALKDVSK